MSLGFRAWGLKFGAASGLGLGIRGSGFKGLQGLQVVFRVRGLELKDLEFKAF